MMIAILLAAAAPSACPAEQAQTLVGERYDERARESARRMAGPLPVRWILPGSAVTQDYSPQRLNLEVGEDGRVAKAWCG